MGDKKHKEQGSSLGRKLVLAVVLLGGGLGAAFYLAPDTVQAQLESLRGLFGQ
jgi:hypothetical protein